MDNGKIEEDSVGLLSAEPSQRITSPDHVDTKAYLLSAQQNYKRQQRAFNCFSIVITLFLIVQISIFTSNRYSRSRNSSPYTEMRDIKVYATFDGTNGADCGDSREAARAKGCIFDVMRYAWIHPSCYDREAAEDALARYPWSWYLDINGTRPVNSSELVHHDVAFTQWGYHVEHCKYIFTVAGRASKYKYAVTDDMASYSHAVHCGMVLTTDEFTPEMVGTRNQQWYAKCGNLLLKKLEFAERKLLNGSS